MTIYLDLMADGKRIATVSARETPLKDQWAYEVRYTDSSPKRGMVHGEDADDELRIISRVLQDYCATQCKVKSYGCPETPAT